MTSSSEYINPDNSHWSAHFTDTTIPSNGLILHPQTNVMSAQSIVRCNPRYGGKGRRSARKKTRRTNRTRTKHRRRNNHRVSFRRN